MAELLADIAQRAALPVLTTMDKIFQHNLARRTPWPGERRAVRCRGMVPPRVFEAAHAAVGMPLCLKSMAPVKDALRAFIQTGGTGGFRACAGIGAGPAGGVHGKIAAGNFADGQAAYSLRPRAWRVEPAPSPAALSIDRSWRLPEPLCTALAASVAGHRRRPTHRPPVSYAVSLASRIPRDPVGSTRQAWRDPHEGADYVPGFQRRRPTANRGLGVGAAASVTALCRIIASSGAG